ncbi:hypothetical protein C8R42DRAFT_610701 [Lentinula raphanica]|nr:hypothetical protein C8R42DRAFT_610701 [Lentinula raphanica]
MSHQVPALFILYASPNQANTCMRYGMVCNVGLNDSAVFNILGRDGKHSDIHTTYSQVTPWRRPTAGSARTLNAAKLKSRSSSPAHPAHRSTILTVTLCLPSMNTRCG